jgi:hypothetical protein
MNFYKRKFFFLPLILIMFLYAFSLTGLNNAGRDDGKAYTINEISGDTTEIIQVTAKEYGEKKENIRLEDTGSPKTVNLILYLIYRLTFRNVN